MRMLEIGLSLTLIISKLRTLEETKKQGLTTGAMAISYLLSQNQPDRVKPKEHWK